MKDQLLATWQLHQRIHLYLLNTIAPENLRDLSASKGRSVGEQFAHIHNVRLMWLQSAAPDLLTSGAQSLLKIEKPDAYDQELLAAALKASAEAVGVLLDRALSTTGKIKGFKPHAVGWLGYLISHESHHRGQIALALKQAGHPLDKKTSFGMWEWGTR